MLTLLQAVPFATDTAQAADTVINSQPIVELKTPSLWDFFLMGGPIMWVLLGLSLIAIYLFVHKLLQVRSAGKEDTSFMDRIKDYIHEGKVDSAMALCDKANTPSARMVGKGLSRLGRPMNDVQVAVENMGNIEVGRLENGMPMLAAIAAVAPMIGFLGTVTGMIKSFYNMASSGQAGVDMSVLSSGIYQALVTTVGGLIVGIIVLIAYNYLIGMTDKVVNKMETKTVEFMDVLNEKV